MYCGDTTHYLQLKEIFPLANKYHFVFEAKSVMDFKYCPYCGEEIMQVYPGDFRGFVQCFECEECEERLEFSILQEMKDRFPDTWKKEYFEEGG